jgi:cytochrome c553
MTRWMLNAVVLGLLVAPAASHAAGDPEAGKQKSATCQGCHGADGLGLQPIYPRLAGQYPDYLAKALHDYKAGRRQNAIMQGMVAALSDQDIEDLAVYYGSL